MTDFLTNVETAFLTIFEADPLLSQYNWQRWDSDQQIQIPRGVLGLRSRRDPDETPYQRIEVNLRFEGRPKREPLGTVMAALVNLLEHIDPIDLTNASGNTVTFIGKAINVEHDRPIVQGLRYWTHTFVVYAVAMN
jgi:hypothetical protein